MHLTISKIAPHSFSPWVNFVSTGERLHFYDSASFLENKMGEILPNFSCWLFSVSDNFSPLSLSLSHWSSTMFVSRSNAGLRGEQEFVLSHFLLSHGKDTGEPNQLCWIHPPGSFFCTRISKASLLHLPSDVLTKSTRKSLDLLVDLLQQLPFPCPHVLLPQPFVISRSGI